MTGYLGPVSCDPLGWTVLLATGLLVYRGRGRAKGVRQLHDATVCQPLFAQYLPPLNSPAAALGTLHRQKGYIHVGFMLPGETFVGLRT